MTLKIALIGAGLVGRRHADALSKLPHAVLAAIVDPALARTGPDHQASKEVRNAPVYANLSDMLAQVRPDGAIIATPNQTHVTLGLELIAAGIPVLVEKPIASTTDEAKRLVEEGEATGVPILVGHHRRHTAIIQDAKSRIDAGSLGDIVAVHGMCWLYKPDDYFQASSWRKEPGAGPVMINLIHDVDCLRYLCGSIENVAAYTSHKTRGYRVEDTAAVVLRFRSGALGTLTISDTIVAPWSWEMTAAENPAYPITGETSYWIGGTHGALQVPNARLWTQGQTRGWWEPMSSQPAAPAPQSVDTLVTQLKHFCEVINAEAEPLVSGREGLETLRVVERILAAAAS